jgi:hypothetical protein
VNASRGLGIDEDLDDRVAARRRGSRLRERKGERTARGAHVERLPAVVVGDGADFHSRPTAASSAINARMRAVAVLHGLAVVQFPLQDENAVAKHVYVTGWVMAIQVMKT